MKLLYLRLPDEVYQAIEAKARETADSLNHASIMVLREALTIRPLVAISKPKTDRLPASSKQCPHYQTKGNCLVKGCKFARI